MRYYSFPELVYPRQSRLSRFAGTLGVVGIAGAIGALMGGIAAFTTIGGGHGSPRNEQVVRTEPVKRPVVVALHSAPAPQVVAPQVMVPQVMAPQVIATASPKTVSPVVPPSPAQDPSVVTAKAVASPSVQAPVIAQDSERHSKPLYERAERDETASAGRKAAHRMAQERARERIRSRRHLARKPMYIVPPYGSAYTQQYPSPGWRGGFVDNGFWRD